MTIALDKHVIVTYSIK